MAESAQQPADSTLEDTLAFFDAIYFEELASAASEQPPTQADQDDKPNRDKKSNTTVTIISFDSANVRHHLYNAILSLQGIGKNLLSQYRVEGMLGEGALGTVFFAQHKFSKL